MADKPSRGLVLYGDGLARFVNPTHTHLHSLASRASCGFLSLPHAPPADHLPAPPQTPVPTSATTTAHQFTADCY
ncbi:hypothetical protein RJ639_004590 [Escallonia herrerae]|uniref:Uncharacterized protein n=1 Tax=Escallonia herrerae TaxID=1293975 RepID=A0AA88VZ36_9ASTE|nr:hypothetical protein RJ639_004590 [Escallonia herrerae]